ncbi:hypothetical protein HanXRQr2_Chr06g0263891 [Helianthus annuus]|uniref:Uncharacterized protein n=1 Tax=Helianthus annuus TaxID=4232 RepID=A0A9K3ITG4_HELAN|nr:hypothetical protein HanXRQr2_Chr06g0263891 [Helianthus annuus]KAJ0560889.1 hypothetical protein HanHA300_Chr06g0216491 [Helianthus annuus]KAJ0573928.1 hypothetical protein HanHA89_Chr06g0232291 [Helianthus annuus]KAJ0738263.1 hypothetical protein HanLR1_Chr06g0216221 [Helianthus annuus]KAJ0741155.1 hypothetical protein HanOQP8_Chr06g0224791 [Helianthus annuus]
MMLGRMSMKVRPVVREKVVDAPIWRMFHPDFKGKVEVLACADGDLGALEDPDATGVPKQHMEKHGDKQFRKPKKPHEPVVVPPLVPEVAETREESFSFFDIRSSPPRDAAMDVGVHEEDRRSPSIEVVTLPSAHAEDTGKKAAGQTIADTLDSSNNLIDPQDSEVLGSEKLRSPDAEKPKSPVAEKTSGSTAASTGVEDQPSELEFYYRSYMENQSVNYHRPPWTVYKGMIYPTIPPLAGIS